jgi:hypothetical protein
LNNGKFWDFIKIKRKVKKKNLLKYFFLTDIFFFRLSAIAGVGRVGRKIRTEKSNTIIKKAKINVNK